MLSNRIAPRVATALGLTAAYAIVAILVSEPSSERPGRGRRPSR